MWRQILQFEGGRTEKWYDWEKDMCLFSEKYPTVLFVLCGEGQEVELDIWRAYFRAGKRVCTSTVRRVFVFEGLDQKDTWISDDEKEPVLPSDVVSSAIVFPPL